MHRRPANGESANRRTNLSRLLSTAGPILIASCPVALLGQVATNTARIATPAGVFEKNAQNNESVDSDALLAAITAVNDSVGGISGLAGVNAVVNAFTADTINGVAASASNAKLAVAPGSTVPAGLVFNAATGNVDVAAGTPAGTYSFDYTICEASNPANCKTAKITVTVVAAAITADPDAVSGISGASGTPNVVDVLAGDTLNGAQVSLAQVNLTVTTAATPTVAGAPVPKLDVLTGQISVPADTLAGTYSITYQICETLNPTNCATNTATITLVAAAIFADPDAVSGISGASGTPNVLDVLAGDTLNGTQVLLAQVNLTVTTAATPAVAGAPVPRLDVATGQISVPAGTPAGTYSITYQICEKLNPANCATNIATVTVAAAEIAADPDAVSGINGASGAPNVLDVLAGDTFNGAQVLLPQVNLTVTTAATPVVAGAPVPRLDGTSGQISVPAGTPTGIYTIAYQICEKLNPANCATNIATVTVEAAQIVAADDSVLGLNSGIGAANALNLFSGDLLNKAAATPGNTIITLAPGSSLPAGLTLDYATGQLSVAAGTPWTTYTFVYQLCEKLNPRNCATAKVTVEVVPPRSTLSGIVYNDDNSDRKHAGTEPLRSGWIVEVYKGDVIVGSTATDANGAYAINDLISGPGYNLVFRNPNNNVAFSKIEGLDLPINGSLTNQNLPIDPSGVVYDAVTRNPVAGANVQLVNASGVALPGTCFIDPTQASQNTGSRGEYQFDIVPGASSQCPVGETVYRLQVIPPTGYAAPVSTVLSAEDGVFDATGRPSPYLIAPNASAPTGSDPTTYWLAFRLASGDPNIIHNHIPLDPFLTRTPLVVSKTSTKRTANVGDIVPYTIAVRNTEAVQRAGVAVIDLLPPGFRYVAGSARVDGIAVEPQIVNRTLTWSGQTIPRNATRNYQLLAVIGAGVTTGDRSNIGVARNVLDVDISNRGEAVVSITPSAVFDCAEIIGKVFDDRDGNGYQDKGEPGIPAARLATVRGELVTADEFGRYHITCAAVPNAQIGSNYVLKLDMRTVPEGFAPTSDNPQSIRLTPGKIVELNFGVRRAETSRVTIDDRAFLPGRAELRPDFAMRLAALTRSEAERLIVSITYDAATGENEALVAARLQSVEAAVAKAFADEAAWKRPQPQIETNMRRPTGRSGQESE